MDIVKYIFKIDLDSVEIGKVSFYILFVWYKLFFIYKIFIW